MPTTIGYHQLILDTEDFKAGNVDTGFIPSHAEELAEPPTTGKLVRRGLLSGTGLGLAYGTYRIKVWFGVRVRVA